MKKALCVIGAVLAVCCSCRDSRTAVATDQGDTLRLKYAEKLTIVKHEGFTEVLLADPWNTGKTLHRYLLIDDSANDNEKPNSIPQHLTPITHHPNTSVIKIPLKRAVIATSVQCGLVEQLGEGVLLRGFATCSISICRGCRRNAGKGILPTAAAACSLR